MTKLLLIGILVFGGLGLDKCTYNAPRAAVMTNGG